MNNYLNLYVYTLQNKKKVIKIQNQTSSLILSWIPVISDVITITIA